jgi:hypothetical protein
MMSAIRLNVALPTLLFLLATSGAISAQSANASKPGVKNVQVPFASLMPNTTFKIGGTADWVLVTDDAIWVAGTKPYSVQRLDPITNRIVAKVAGKLLACVPAHRSAEPGSLVVRVDFDDRAELLAADPDVYYVTDHYLNYSAVLVRLSRVTPDVLRDLLGMAHKFVTAHEARPSPSRKRRKPV